MTLVRTPLRDPLIAARLSYSAVTPTRIKGTIRKQDVRHRRAGWHTFLARHRWPKAGQTLFLWLTKNSTPDAYEKLWERV